MEETSCRLHQDPAGLPPQTLTTLKSHGRPTAPQTITYQNAHPRKLGLDLSSVRAHNQASGISVLPGGTRTK